MLAESARSLKENPTFAATVERFMKDADTGIRELRVVDEKVVETRFSEVRQETGIQGEHKTQSFIPTRHGRWLRDFLPPAAGIVWNAPVCGFARRHSATQPAPTPRLH